MSHSCSVCLEEYDPHTRIPKNLECGHSLCCLCLIILLKGSRSCPVCRTGLMRKCVEDYQTVFQLLHSPSIMNRRGNNSVGCYTDLKMQLRKIKESHERALKSSESDLNDREMEMCRIQQSMSKLEENRRFFEKELKTTNQNLKHLEEIVPGRVGFLQETGEAEQLESSSFCASGYLIPHYHFKLGDFMSYEAYMREVCDQIERGKPVFACHKCHDGLFYAKVSFKGGHTFWNNPNGLVKVGSLTHTDVEDDAMITPFEDLKRVSEGHFIAFFEFRYEEWKDECFIPLNASPLAWQFLTLCTGEEGPTYRGSPIQLNPYIWSVTHYQRNGSLTSGHLPSMTSLPSEDFWNLDEDVVEGFPDGSFKIKCDNNYFNYTSKNVINDGPFYCHFPSVAPLTVPDKTILECGFALKV